MIGVIVGGIGVLGALAALIGVALDREARSGAWERIAGARRLTTERQRAIDDRSLELMAVAVELEERERRLDLRERRLFEREAHLELLERAPRSDPSS